MRELAYVRPTEPAEAVAAVTADPQARYLAGGSNLVDHLKLRITEPETLVDVRGLGLMIGFYLAVTGRRVGSRPEDRLDGEVHEGSGEQGMFSPWSWWPLALGSGAAVVMLGMAVGVWIVFIGLFLGVIGLVGWVFEYSRGLNAH